MASSASSASTSEDLKRRRELLVVRATDQIAVWSSLKDEPPSDDNATARGDFDEAVEILIQEMADWRADAIAFARTFAFINEID